MQEFTVDYDFVESVQRARQTLVESSAALTNVVRVIEQESSAGTSDPVIKDAIFQLRGVSNSLSQYWAELDLSLAAHDLCTVGRA